MIIVGRRVIPWILHYTAHTGSRELFRLAVLTIALGVAFGGGKLFGVSFALGAFFAGMILSESSSRSRRPTSRCRSATPSPCCSSSRSACCSTPSILFTETLAVIATVRDHRRRQIGRCARHRAGLPLPARDSAHDLGELGPNRRVLVHSRGTRHEPRIYCRSAGRI